MTDYRPTRDESNTSELEVLAIQEQFIDEFMRGMSPRLSVYLLRYPQYAAELAAFVAAFLDDPESATEIALQGTSAPGGALSSGMETALKEIARSSGRLPEASIQARSMVAEATVEYHAGLAALRSRCGFSREEVAHRADLSPKVIAWLEQRALVDTERAKVIVARLAEALGVSPEEVKRVLSGTEETRESVPWETARAHILNDRSLTRDQRKRWRQRLRERA
jgi:transcriptional regulator with XRE-family HTH domain